MIPIIQSYTLNPDPPKATDVIEAIEKIQPVVDNFFKLLDPTDQPETECTGSNPIGSLFAAAKCAVDTLTDTVIGVESEIEVSGLGVALPCRETCETSADESSSCLNRTTSSTWT